MTIFGFLLWFSLTLGYQSYAEHYVFLPYQHPPVYTNVELHAENSWLDLYGKYGCEMDLPPTRIWEGFAPKQDYFVVGATASYKHISLNFEHMCQHPVGILNPHPTINGEYGGYNRISVTIRSTP